MSYWGNPKPGFTLVVSYNPYSDLYSYNLECDNLIIGGQDIINGIDSVNPLLHSFWNDNPLNLPNFIFTS